MKRGFILAALLAALLVSSVLAQDTAQDHLALGVSAFNADSYVSAVEHFQKAARLQPGSIDARLHLANTYLSLYRRNARSPEAPQLARECLRTYQEVLQLDPGNKLATWGMASLYAASGDTAQAREWCQKLLSLDPTSRDAYYTLGVLAFTSTFAPIMQGRKAAGLAPQDRGLIQDTGLRKSLQDSQLPVLEDGLRVLRKANELDPDSRDVMAFLNLLYRSKAYLADTKEAADLLIATADEWVRRAISAGPRSATAKLDARLPAPPAPAPAPPPPPPRPAGR